MNYKPTIGIERSFRPDPDTLPWSTQYLIDEVYISLMNMKEIFCMINSNRKASIHSDLEQLEVDNKCNSSGLPRLLYKEQIKYKLYRIPIFLPPPVIVVYLKHLDERVKQELARLDSETKDFVVQEAIGKICEHIDRRLFLLSVKPLLRWRFES